MPRPLPLLLLVILLAACASPLEPAPSTNPVAPESTGSTTPFGEVGDQESGEVLPMPSDISDPELEARVPRSIESQTFDVVSYNFASAPVDLAAQAFAGADTMSALLEREGRSWADVSAVTAMTDPLTSRDPTVRTAYLTGVRVRGASEAGLRDWFERSGIAIGEAATRTIGDKTILDYGVPGLDGSPLLAWFDGDVVFWLANANPASFGERIIAALG